MNIEYIESYLSAILNRLNNAKKYIDKKDRKNLKNLIESAEFVLQQYQKEKASNGRIPQGFPSFLNRNRIIELMDKQEKFLNTLVNTLIDPIIFDLLNQNTDIDSYHSQPAIPNRGAAGGGAAKLVLQPQPGGDGEAILGTTTIGVNKKNRNTAMAGLSPIYENNNEENLQRSTDNNLQITMNKNGNPMYYFKGRRISNEKAHHIISRIL